MSLHYETEQFFVNHCASPSGVILVFVGRRVEVFSCLETAIEFAATQSEFCTFSPHVIDVPEYGEIPKEMVN